MAYATKGIVMDVQTDVEIQGDIITLLNKTDSDLDILVTNHFIDYNTSFTEYNIGWSMRATDHIIRIEDE